MSHWNEKLYSIVMTDILHSWETNSQKLRQKSYILIFAKVMIVDAVSARRREVRRRWHQPGLRVLSNQPGDNRTRGQWSYSLYGRLPKVQTALKCASLMLLWECFRLTLGVTSNGFQRLAFGCETTIDFSCRLWYHISLAVRPDFYDISAGSTFRAKTTTAPCPLNGGSKGSNPYSTPPPSFEVKKEKSENWSLEQSKLRNLNWWWTIINGPAHPSRIPFIRHWSLIRANDKAPSYIIDIDPCNQKALAHEFEGFC